MIFSIILLKKDSMVSDNQVKCNFCGSNCSEGAKVESEREKGYICGSCLENKFQIGKLFGEDIEEIFEDTKNGKNKLIANKL